MTKVTIEAWESICDSVEAIIKEGQMACEHRLTTVRFLLGYLDWPTLDPNGQALSTKLQLEQVEQHFDAAKEQIQQINQLMMQEIKRWIEIPHASMAQIQVYLKEWKKVKRVRSHPKSVKQKCTSDMPIFRRLMNS